MLKKKSIVIVFVFCVFVLELFIYSTRTKNSMQSRTADAIAVEQKDSIDFCGERVPLHSQDILERYEHEILKNAYWHSQINITYKRTGKFFPLIEKILQEEGIPDDFKYVCIIESGLDNVVSPVGAAGFWQIMETTGKEYGLEISKDIDERYHLAKATRVACQYFKRAHKKFNSWTLAAASYNIGISGIERRLKKQKTNNYYDLHLNSETSRYIFRALALKEILNHPERYDFSLNEKHKYKPVPVRTVTVDSSISDLTIWSEAQEINYKILKIFNPWLRNSALRNPSRKKYEIKIPISWVFKFASEENDSTKITDSIAVNTIDSIEEQDVDSSSSIQESIQLLDTASIDIQNSSETEE